jgi:fumarate reductase flavoprotein subunit
MLEYNAQIAVIAAGPSGLSAAVQAAEDGASVIVLEKAAAAGGAANMGMGPLGIGTKYQKQQMIDISVEKAFNMFMEYTHYNVDARLVKKYFDLSADTIEWLEDMGVEFEGAFKYFPKSEATWHIVKTDEGIGPRAASFMNRILFERAKELGVEFLFETPAKKILKENGDVVGVLATNQNDEEIKINCNAAIICTGGAGANKKMIKDETGLTHEEDLFSFAIPGLTGDGLKMAWEVGADKTQIRIEMAASIEGLEELPQSLSNVFGQPNLLINQFGKRVMNEDYMQNSTYLSNVAMHQKGKVLYSIIDTSIAKYYMRNGVDNVSLVRTDPDVSDFLDAIQMAQENNNKDLIVADTIEELADKIGVDPEILEETVEMYNDFCDEVDEEFFKDKRYLRPLIKAPYYCAKIRPGGYGTVGGIRINENCEVIDKEFEPISGLYAAGADSCNIYDDSYMFLLPGNSMGYAVNTGRIAGMSAAEYVEE